MSLDPTDLHWARPWVLAGLALAIPFWIVRLRASRRDRVPFPPLQFDPVRHARGHLAGLSLAVELVLLVGLVIGVAGPYTRSTIERVDDAGIDMTLVLDVSLSMLAEDFEPNRLAALRRIAGEFLSRRSSDRIALVIFAKDTFVQSPLTTDDAVLQQLLAGVRVDAIDQHLSGGTAIGDALLVAADQLSTARIPERDQSVILITDGESNDGIDPELAARYLRELDIRFYAVGVGGPVPVEVFREGRRIGDGLMTQLDDDALERLAAAGDGSYFRASDDGSLEEIFAGLSRLQSAALERRTIERRHSLAPQIALLLVGVFGAYVGLGSRLRSPLR